MRLDRVLSARFPTLSRSYLQTLVDAGEVTLDGVSASARSGKKPRCGTEVVVRLVTPSRELPLTPEDIALDVLYEDAHVVVINKPPGMVVHPAPGNWTGTLVHALTHRYPGVRAMGGPRPGIVHRLDKGTSGVLVAALTPEAQRGMMALFAAREVRKEYVALTAGNPAGMGCVSRTICEPIGRSPRDRLQMQVLAEELGGRWARSRVSVLASQTGGVLYAVRVGIESGRTHQIRVHLRHAGAPVLGDETYGAPNVNRRFRSAAARPMLHAEQIAFVHPVSGKEVLVRAEVAGDMKRLVQKIGMERLEGGMFEW